MWRTMLWPTRFL